MINSYEIKIENNEPILCLHLDFNYEFAKFDFKEKKQNLENMIKKYIKENKINFKGTKVVIIVGGILMGTLLLSNPIISENIEYTSPSIMENIIVENEQINEDIKDVVINESKTEEKIEEPKEEIKIENVKKEEPTTQIKNETTKEPIKETVKVEQTNNQITETKQEEKTEIKEEIKQEETTETKEETKKEEVEIQANKTYVTIYRTNGTVATIELEEYVIGVVAAEMPASFHTEALKAQAIIARTYALKAIGNNKVLTDNSSTQNYKDNSQLKTMWGSSYNTYYNKIKNAVESTKGNYLTYNNQIIEAVYHSTSNGYTEAAESVWGNEFAYLVSVESKYDSTNSSFIKEKYMTYEELSEALQTTITQDTAFSISGYTSGQRVQTIQVNDKNYTGVKFRSLLGLRSADFEIKKDEEGVTITTKGYGHGVGLSQYGANGMAKNGYKYNQILKHYYQGIKINNM